jgi:hypothetical protein
MVTGKRAQGCQSRWSQEEPSHTNMHACVCKITCGMPSRALQAGHYKQGTTSRALQAGHYKQGTTSRALQAGHYKQGTTSNLCHPDQTTETSIQWEPLTLAISLDESSQGTHADNPASQSAWEDDLARMLEELVHSLCMKEHMQMRRASSRDCWDPPANKQAWTS